MFRGIKTAIMPGGNILDHCKVTGLGLVATRAVTDITIVPLQPEKKSPCGDLMLTVAFLCALTRSRPPLTPSAQRGPLGGPIGDKYVGGGDAIIGGPETTPKTDNTETPIYLATGRGGLGIIPN